MKIQRKTFLSLTFAAVLAAACASTGTNAVDATAALNQANQAMGTNTVNSLRFAGSGTGAVYGQAWQPGTVWPKTTVSQFSRLMDYSNAAMREEMARSRAEVNGGGALPLLGEGEQRTIGALQGEFAWNVAGQAQTPSPLAATTRIHDLWTSPHGVLKAAANNKATAVRGADGAMVLSFSHAGRFTAKAFVNAQGLVERVESRMPQTVLGETAVVTWYSDYKDHGGVKFPARIRQSQDGTETLNVAVSEVQVNAPAQIVAFENVRQFTERAASELVAPGVWHIAGGSHNSVLIEMRDHAVLVESPLYDARAAVVLAEAKRLLPSKPIRFVVNSHHHFDHAGGLRAAASEGASILVSAQGVPFFETALNQASTIAPDLLAKSGKRAKVEGISGKRVLTDGTRQVELYLMQDSVHANGFVMAYLPAERILIEADAYTPAAAGTAPPAKPNGNHLNLMANIDKLGLKVDTIAPLHGRVVPISELYAMVGRK